jgi:hypothetical protein
MKSWLWNGMLAAAVALPALSSMARAQSTDNERCSNATLKGDYAFVVTDVTFQIFVVGIAQFDGEGEFTQVDYPAGGLLSTPPLTAFRTGETGTYTVGKDCTGMAELDLNVPGVACHGIHYLAFVISNGGRSFHAVSSGAIPAGPAPCTLIADQDRVDFWKVGSERDDQ